MRNKSPGYTRPGKKTQVSTTRPHQGEVIPPNAEASAEGLLSRHPDFVAKWPGPMPEPDLHKCEASALSTELIAPIRAYFTPKNHACKMGALASSNFSACLERLVFTKGTWLTPDLVPVCY